MADGKVFYPSFFSALEEIDDDKTFRQAVEAVFRYAFDGEETDMSEMKSEARIIYTMSVPLIDSNNSKITNGRKGGRPPKNHVKEETADNKADTEEDKEPSVSDRLNLDKLPGMFKDKRVADKMKEWLEYRFSLRDAPYNEISAKKAIEDAQIAEKKYGAEACISNIQQSISSGWKGIFWNKLEKQYSKNKKQYEANNGPAVEYEPTKEDYERIRRAMEKEEKASKT